MMVQHCYSECHLCECHIQALYAEGHYAECPYADNVNNMISLVKHFLTKNLLNNY